MALCRRLASQVGAKLTYEPPENAEIVLEGGEKDADELADEVIAYLKNTGKLG